MSGRVTRPELFKHSPAADVSVPETGTVPARGSMSRSSPMAGGRGNCFQAGFCRGDAAGRGPAPRSRWLPKRKKPAGGRAGILRSSYPPASRKFSGGKRRAEHSDPALAVCELDPMNMFCNMWNLFGCFRLPVKACRPQPQTGSGDRIIYGSRTVRITNRAGKFFLRSKINLTFTCSALLFVHLQIFSSIKFGFFCGCRVDRRPVLWGDLI